MRLITAHRPSQILIRIACAAALLFLTTSTLASPPPAAATSIATIADQSYDLARNNRLNDVWRGVMQLDSTHPATKQLQDDVSAYLDHRTLQNQADSKTLDYKLQRLATHAAAGHTVKALTAAVESYPLADDPQTVLTKPSVVQLVASAESEASDFEAQGRWLKALTIYNRLDMLFHRQNRYYETIDRIDEQIALLRLFAPDRLFQMYVQQAQDDGEPKPEPWNIDPDEWKDQVRDIDAEMLKEALSHSASMYVEPATFHKLILGLFNGLDRFFQAKGLDATFPSLADPNKVKNFTDHLNALRQTVEARQDPMTLNEASSVINRLLEKNQETLQIPESVLCQRMGNGAMKQLDKFSAIIWPHDKAVFERTTRGKFYGIGVRISVVNSELVVVSPLPGSPAFDAGIRTGDTIMTIAGKIATGIDLNRAVDLITGPQGSTIDLEIRPAGKTSTHKVTVTRRPIRVVSCKGWSRKPNGDWNFYIDPDARVGYVRLTGFGPTTVDELDAAVQSMADDRGINSLIIDLRFNPGGRLDSAVDISNRFLDTGTIVSTTKQMFPGRPWRAPATTASTYQHFPVSILINDGSASASEIVAGALQVHKRALIIGATSYGKGSVQNLFHVGGRRAFLKLTTQYYKLPDNRIIHRRKGSTNWGIRPGLPVRMSDQQVRDLISARMIMDVLHDPNEKDATFNAELLFSENSETEEPTAPDEIARLDMLEQIKNFTSPNDILTHNLDPQLEAALLLMKVKALAQPQPNPQLATP